MLDYDPLLTIFNLNAVLKKPDAYLIKYSLEF